MIFANDRLADRSRVYDRTFLNCFKRQIICCLSCLDVPVDALLYSSLLGSEDIYRTTVYDAQPRTSVQCPLLESENLAQFGIHLVRSKFSTHTEFFALLDEGLRTHPFVMIFGDVLQMEHRWSQWEPPVHDIHSCVVVDSTGEHYRIIDDNHDSYLDSFVLTPEKLAMFTFSDQVREVLTLKFEGGPSYSGMVPTESYSLEWIRQQCQRISVLSIERILQVLSYTEFNRSRTATSLHECFASIHGSRKLFLRFLKYINAPEGLCLSAQRVVDASYKLKSYFLKSSIAEHPVQKPIESSLHSWYHSEREFIELCNSYAGA